MELLTLAVSPNALATSGSTVVDEAARAAGGSPAEGPDFATLLAASMTSAMEMPATGALSESGTETPLAAEQERDTRAPSIDPGAIVAGVPTLTPPPALPLNVPAAAQNAALPAQPGGSTEPHLANKSATAPAALAAHATGIAVHGNGHPVHADGSTEPHPANKSATAPAALAAQAAGIAVHGKGNPVHPGGSTEPHPAGESATAPAALAAQAAGIAVHGKGHPAEAASDRADIAIHFGAKEAPGDPVLPAAPWRSENALHVEANQVHALTGGARESELATPVPHAATAHAVPVTPAELRAPTGPTAVREVAAPVQSSDFADAFSRQVVWMVDKDAQVAELRLNPPELGPVEVRLTVSGDEASAQFVSAHAEVRAAIESSLARLRESLAEAGIELGEAFVSAESFRDDSSASNAGSGQSSSAYGEPARERTLATHGATPSTLRRSLIDVFA